MNLFTISQLQGYSGIKAHTIRIWEKRYNALSPHRTEGNTRYYDGSQLRRLLNIVSLLDSGLKISMLCSLSDDQLHKLVEESYSKLDDTQGDALLFSSQLIAAAFDYDEKRFETLFENCLRRSGLRDTYKKVIYPVLARIGIMWASNTMPPAHEHFIVNLISRKILSCIDNLPPAKADSTAWILFLPEDEHHETGLLMAYFLLRQAGKKVFYLGADVPMDSLKGAMLDLAPANVLGFLIGKNDKNEGIKMINNFSKTVKPNKLYLACAASDLDAFTEKKYFVAIHNIEDLEALIK